MVKKTRRNRVTQPTIWGPSQTLAARRRQSREKQEEIESHTQPSGDSPFTPPRMGETRVVGWAAYPDKEGHSNTKGLPWAAHAQTRQVYNLQ